MRQKLETSRDFYYRCILRQWVQALFLTADIFKPLVVVPWQSATSFPELHQTMVPEEQLISQYAALTSSGNGMFYPGGMAATMGGGGCGGS